MLIERDRLSPNIFSLQARVVIPYLLFASAWILITDWKLIPAILGRSDPEFSWLQTAKGFLFVAVTGLLLFFLLGAVLRRLVSAQNAGIQSESRFRLLANNAVDVVYRYRFLPEPGFEYVSPSIRNLIGYTPEEMYGNSELRNQLVHPEDRETALVFLAATNDPKKSLEVRWVRKDGSFVWVQQRIRIERDGAGRVVAVESIVRDITEQKRAELALRASEERYRKLIEQASDGIFVVDSEGHFLELSDQACLMLGASREELLNRRYHDFVSARSIEQLPLHFGKVRPGDLLRFEREYVRKDGTTFPADISASVMEGGYVQFIVRDATSRKQYERGLIEAREKADEMVRMKDAFLANMSHEIRTPLTAVIGFADLMYAESEGPAKEYAESIQNGGRRLLETLNSVLDLAQLRGEALQLSPQSVSPIREAHRVLDLFKFQAEKKGLDLRLETAPGCPSNIMVDSGALGRILTNLVSNGIKFTERGHVTVTLSGDAEQIMFEVADTGIGIGKEYRVRLFDEFSQEASGMDRPYEGNGLGLAITRRLVDLMGGTIEVCSEPGRGTCMRVTLPTGGHPS